MGYTASDFDATLHPSSWFGPADTAALLEERARVDHEEAYERHQRALAAGEWSPFEGGPFETMETSRVHWARWLRELRRPMTTVEEQWSREVLAKHHDAALTKRLAGKSKEHVRERKLEWAGAVRASADLADPELVMWAEWFCTMQDRWF